MARALSCALAAAAAIAGCGLAAAEGEVWDGNKFVPKSEAGSIPPPNLNVGGQQITDDSLAHLDESELMGNMPRHMQCDSCYAVAWQMATALGKADALNKGKRMKEFKVLEAMEAVCLGEKLDSGLDNRHYDWGEYSIRTDKERGNFLAGPGCVTEDQLGFGQYGGFKTRLEVKCNELLGEVGEDEIYEHFRESPTTEAMKKFMCDSSCSEAGAKGAGGKKKKKKAGGGAKKKKKKKKKAKDGL